MKPSRNVDKTKKTERDILFFRNQNDWQIPRKKERKKEREREREREMQVCEQRVDIKMFLSVRIFPTLTFQWFQAKTQSQEVGSLNPGAGARDKLNNLSH